ncbi:MAG TPA: hypothetical protein VGB26_12280 [Nitrospiria bacterium]|jgi:hypothetical protein
MTLWEPANSYSAKIGGIYYRNVTNPIEYKGIPLISLAKNPETGELAATFKLLGPNKSPIAQIKNNSINLKDKNNYTILSGFKRTSIVEKKTGRVVCEIKKRIKDSDLEIEISALLFTDDDYPIILHPDRSKFGTANDNKPPNIAFLKLTTNKGNQASAIAVENRGGIYLLGVEIENFKSGISIKN